MTRAMVHSSRSIQLRASTWNEESRSFEAVISTGAPVRRRDSKGAFIERLDIAAVDASSLRDLPVLDNHRQGSTRDVIGTVRSARFESGQLIATISLGSAEDIGPIAARAKDGHVSLSIGYFEQSRADRVERGQRVRTVIPEIFEVSLVAVPADRAARIRSQHMPDDIEVIDDAPAVSEADQARIRSLGEIADLPPSFAEGQIEAGATVEEARAAAREAMVQRSAPRIRVISPDRTEDPAIRVRAMSDALDARLAGTAPSEAGREFMGASLREMAATCLHVRGVSTRGMNPDALFRAAHTTSDFPQLLQGTGHRALMASYQAAASPLKQVARQGSRVDFRPGSTLKLGEIGALQPLTESGEIKSVSRSEAAESYSLKTFAAMFSLTRVALINDDLGAFGDWARAAGQAAATTEAEVLWSLLSQSSGAGPIMGEDGKRLFHVDHGNLAASGHSLASIIGLKLARKALRGMKGLDGKTIIAVTPKYLVVGPDRETEAEKLLTAIAAAKTDDVNPFAGKLTLLVESRIKDSSWYLFADPATAPVLEYSYLSSAPGPQMASREGWDVLSTEYRVVLDFGAGAVDWRGAYRDIGSDDPDT